MEAATITEPETPVAAEADDTDAPKQLYRFSTWLHVGPGAEECEAVDEKEGSNDCQNPLHFHAWCRLPNQFQHRTLRDKALAAKARKQRQLRDPETDAAAILEEDLAAIADRPEGREQFVDELLAPNWWRDFFEAQQDVMEKEDDEGEKPYASIDHDQRRYEVLKAMPEDERPEDEYGELGRHLVAYHEAVRVRQEEIVQPKRDELEALDADDLLQRVRRQRIEKAGDEEFMHVYAAESWFIGTLKAKHGKQVFANREAMHAAAPEVIDALKETFADLERSAQGNS